MKDSVLCRKGGQGIRTGSRANFENVMMRPRGTAGVQVAKLAAHVGKLANKSFRNFEMNVFSRSHSSSSSSTSSSSSNSSSHP